VNETKISHFPKTHLSFREILWARAIFFLHIPVRIPVNSPARLRWLNLNLSRNHPLRHHRNSCTSGADTYEDALIHTSIHSSQLTKCWETMWVDRLYMQVMSRLPTFPLISSVHASCVVSQSWWLYLVWKLTAPNCWTLFPWILEWNLVHKLPVLLKLAVMTLERVLTKPLRPHPWPTPWCCSWRNDPRN
jgi:hypothetical protein